MKVRRYCRQNDENEDNKDGEEGEMQDNVQGTGMGEGEGKKDVSNEIEDEEQLLGNQNEQKDMKENQEKKV